MLPGIVCLVLMSITSAMLAPPELKQTPDAVRFARGKLERMGPLSAKEKVMLGTFGLLLVLWANLPAGLDARPDRRRLHRPVRPDHDRDARLGRCAARKKRLGHADLVWLMPGAYLVPFLLMMTAGAAIMMSLTHYASGTSPIIFGSGYVTMGTWWRVGFVMCVVELLMFATLGLA